MSWRINMLCIVYTIRAFFTSGAGTSYDSENMSSPPVLSGIRITRSLVFFCMSCRSFCVLFYFFFWPLCCLFFDTRYLQGLLISNTVHLVMCDGREPVLIVFLIIKLYFFPPPMHFTLNASNVMNLKLDFFSKFPLLSG